MILCLTFDHNLDLYEVYFSHCPALSSITARTSGPATPYKRSPSQAAYSIGNIWRCRLYSHGPRCKFPGCGFAHALRDQLPPNEMHVEYPRTRVSVDRLYGQIMSQTQLTRIRC